MSGYYGATITEHADSIDVYLEAVEGGYNLYTMVSGAKKYIIAEYTGTHKNFKYLDAPNSVWTYSAEYNTIITVVDGKQVFIGTRQSFDTIGEELLYLVSGLVMEEE